jgi:hypothetical protein
MSYVVAFEIGNAATAVIAVMSSADELEYGRDTTRRKNRRDRVVRHAHHERSS